MMKVILWDVDGTLLNFLAAEEQAIRSCFAHFGLGECTDEMLEAYSKINKKYWKRLEDGVMTKPEILVGRFREFFEVYGLDTSVAEAFNKEYQVRLGDTIVFCDDAYNLVSDLRSRVKQYAVTNGTKVAQDRKLSKSGLDQLFDGIFISDVLGVEKPNLEFFQKVFNVIGEYAADEVVIVGDSLSSDIRGGNNAGILCAWYNPGGDAVPAGVRVDYDLRNLQEIREILA